MKYKLIPKLLVLKGRVGREEGKPNPLIGYCFVTNNQYDQSRTSEGSMSVNEIDILNGFFSFLVANGAVGVCSFIKRLWSIVYKGIVHV